jgi:hypothetical protein
MLDKINIGQIIRDHISTLKNDATQRVGSGDYLLFLAAPFICAGLSIGFGLQLKENIVTLLIAAFSIFAGLLINVLVLIYTVTIRLEDVRIDSGDSNIDLEREFLRQIFSNVSFGILLSIMIVFVSILCAILSACAGLIASSVCVFLIVEFTFTLLMSLKRLHILLVSRFER